MDDVTVMENLHWGEPCIGIEKVGGDVREDWSVSVAGTGVEIDFGWDYGYGGCGASKFTIPLAVLKNAIEKTERANEEKREK